MRYAILGDIHANLAALEAVLDALSGEAVDQMLQVGDVVGYGAAPKEVIALTREVGMRVVQGNHDAACVGTVDPTTFNEHARAAVTHTMSVLDRDELRWLAGLPLTLSTEHCSMSHGTLVDPERFAYIQSTEDGDPSLDALLRPVCFLGHTHRPVTLMRLKESPRRTSYTFADTVDLADVTGALVNVGSVGQPRDDDPRAAYAIYDTETSVVRIRRVDYDIEREADRIVRAGLPQILADRLFLGI